MKLNHHAYIIEKVSDDGLSVILNFISKVLEIEKDPHSSPNFLHIKSNQLSVDEAGKVVAFNSQKSFGQNGGGNKVALIEINGAGHQAQNALLKTLEEPFPNTYFFITISSVSLLLPTIKSRVETYNLVDFLEKFNLSGGDAKDKKLGHEADDETIAIKIVKHFLGAGLAERVEIAKKMAEDAGKEGEDDSSKLFQFLHDIEITLKNLEKTKLNRHLSEDELKTLITVREYFADGGASKKMLLEYLALKLPILKNL
jgi:DNA polymerase III delta prime subunit